MVYAYNLPDVHGERGYDAYYSYYSSSAYPSLGSGTTRDFPEYHSRPRRIVSARAQSETHERPILWPGRVLAHRLGVKLHGEHAKIRRESRHDVSESKLAVFRETDRGRRRRRHGEYVFDLTLR